MEMDFRRNKSIIWCFDEKKKRREIFFSKNGERIIISIVPVNCNVYKSN